ncbi:sugar phosphate isomerase/epimerase [Rhodobacteraceae bacterium CCMM004]|nr:sugar phosphate isomerase/epimerase [Rhodobacteraceae bacterium CCMM004]
MVAGLGYDAVEGYGALFSGAEAVAALRRALDVTGLTMPTAHVGWDMVRDDPGGVVDLARTLGVALVVVPGVDAAGWGGPDWHRFAAELAGAAAPLRQAGLTVGWHNHAAELTDVGGGTRAIDLLLAADPDLVWEIDVAWVARAGADPVAWIDRHAGRIAAAHLKDLAAPGAAADEEDGWADVGHGRLDWTAILDALDRSGAAHFVVEHDRPSDDRRFAARSIAALRGR